MNENEKRWLEFHQHDGEKSEQILIDEAKRHLANARTDIESARRWAWFAFVLSITGLALALYAMLFHD